MNKKWKSLKTNSIRRYLKNAKWATNNTNNYKKKKKRRIKYKQTLKVKTYKKMLNKPLYYVHMCQKHVYLYDQQSKRKFNEN